MAYIVLSMQPLLTLLKFLVQATMFESVSRDGHQLCADCNGTDPLHDAVSSFALTVCNASASTHVQLAAFNLVQTPQCKQPVVCKESCLFYI